MPPRRTLLVRAAAVVGSLVAAGCLGDASAADGVGAARTGGGESASAETATNSGGDASPASTDAPARPARGANVAVTRSVVDPDLRYDASRDAVRVVAAYRHTNHEAVANGSEPPTSEPVYEWLPFERWAEAECASVAAESVRSAIEKRLGSVAGLGVGVESSGDDGDGDDGGDLAVSAFLTTTYDRDGNAVSEPDATVAEVAAVAPASVATTVRLGGREHACTHRTAVDDRQAHQQ